MSIEKDHNGFYLVCDVCGLEDSDRIEYFDNLIEHKKEIGWTGIYDNGWWDTCTDCKS